MQKNHSKPMTHIKFRRHLVKEHVGDLWEGTGATTRRRTSTSDQEQRLNGKLHVIIPHPEGKRKDCLVCSKRMSLEEEEKLSIFVRRAPENLSSHRKLFQKISYYEEC
jgi:hypothetical protein